MTFIGTVEDGNQVVMKFLKLLTKLIRYDYLHKDV